MTPAAELDRIAAQIGEAIAACNDVRKGKVASGSRAVAYMDARCVNFVVDEGERVLALVAALRAAIAMRGVQSIVYSAEVRAFDAACRALAGDAGG